MAHFRRRRGRLQCPVYGQWTESPPLLDNGEATSSSPSALNNGATLKKAWHNFG
ncbi:MAG: hypothetical protein JRI57_11035 [Deltaproteobacteria bacterium]|nr:hypothetical protein [Deltaproteobacteria bacterium]